MKPTGASELTPYKSILRKTDTSLASSPFRRRHQRMNSNGSAKSFKSVSFFETVSHDDNSIGKSRASLPSHLSDFEKREIVSYKNVYFYPKHRVRPVAHPSLENNGFSDKGVYQGVIHDHIAYRFEILDLLEQTNFSQIFRAFDHKRREMIALKIINNVFHFFKHSEKEVEVLLVLKKAQAPGVVKLLDSFVFRNHRVLVFELLQTNLLQRITETRFRGLSIEEVKRVAFKVLSTLKQIHLRGVIHCDLKPENIMFRDEDIKIIDFGAASFMKKLMFLYVQSRYYRSPEVILGCPYTSAIDIWGFGCILLEMVNGLPPFRGEDEHQQLLSIMEFRGYPDRNLIIKGRKAEDHFYSFDKVIIRADSSGKHRVPGSKSIRSLVPNISGLAELAEACLDMNPTKRITAASAMKHSFFCKNTAVKNSPLKRRKHIKSLSNILLV